MFGGAPPRQFLLKSVCVGAEGDSRSGAMLGMFLHLGRFSFTLLPPPFALRPSSPQPGQDGGAVAGYSSFLCPPSVWPTRSLDLLGLFFFVVSTLEVFPLLEAVFKRVMRLFSVLLITDVVLAAHVVMYLHVSVCAYIHMYMHPTPLILCCWQGKPTFEEGLSCVCAKDNCFLCSCTSVIVISDSHKQDMKGAVDRIRSPLFPPPLPALYG